MSSPKRPRKQSPSLPYDLLLNCLARVSRLHYPTLSLVSKSFQSLIASPELYKTRSLLNRTESCLYVCLKFPSDPNPRWFTLCQKPNQTLTNDKKTDSSGYVLIPISATPGKEYNHGLVAVGCNIYSIGGSSIENAPSSSVSILDCRSHKWHDGPSMLMKRNKPAANVVDGKIYVAGGCKDFDSSNGIEVFDLKTQTWELVLSPRLKNRILKSTVAEGQIFYYEDIRLAAYKPKEVRWEDEGDRTYQPWYFDVVWRLTCNCVIDNIVYFYSNFDGIQYCNSVPRCLKKLKGLQGLPDFHSGSLVKFADYGGKLAVFWDTCLPGSGMKISCALISLERRETKEIWGKVEWLADAVLTVPRTYKFVAGLAAIL